MITSFKAELRRDRKLGLLGLLRLVVCAGVVGSAAGQAQTYRFESPNIEEKQWAEEDTALPAYPKDENLLALNVSAVTDNKFFVDPESISVGDDGVVRYSLVVKSSAGATNVSFEGIRCDTKEWKAYAFGRQDGTWEKAKRPTWRIIRQQTANRQHYELYKHYYCRDGIIKKPQQAISILKQGGPKFSGRGA